MQRNVRRHSQTSPDLVQGPRLGHVPWHPVEDVPTTTFFCCDKRDAYHFEYDLVGNQFTPVQMFLDRATDESSLCHVLAQQIAGGDVWYVEVRSYQSTLGSFSCPWRRDQQNSHHASLPLDGGMHTQRSLHAGGFASTSVVEVPSGVGERVVFDAGGRDLHLGEPAEGGVHHRRGSGDVEVVVAPGAVARHHVRDGSALAGIVGVLAGRAHDGEPRVFLGDAVEVFTVVEVVALPFAAEQVDPSGAVVAGELVEECFDRGESGATGDEDDVAA